MNVAKLILGFAPWIAYTVVVNWAGPTSVPIAALVALAIAAALIVRTVLHGATRPASTPSTGASARRGGWACW